MAIATYAQLGKSKMFLSELISNWQSEPFSSLEISLSKECPNKLDKFIVNKYYLSCQKTNGSYFIDKELYDYSVLEDSHSKTVCGKRYANFNYEDHLNKTYLNTTKCEKNCGKLDTLGNYLCVNTHESCPVNRINFVASENVTAGTVENYYVEATSEVKSISDVEKIVINLDMIQGMIK